MCMACCDTFTCPALSVASAWRSVRVLYNDCCVLVWCLHCTEGSKRSYVQCICQNCNCASECINHVLSQIVLQVNTMQVQLKHPMPKQSEALCRSKSCSVRVRLEPMGALVRITDIAQLRSLVYSLLSTLNHIHEYDFVHRDIRLENVVKATTGWVLIDWELAGRTNQFVWWEGNLLPDGVKHRLEPYTCKTDLWQLGMLIRNAAVSADVAIASFADHLLDGDFVTAAIAQASLW